MATVVYNIPVNLVTAYRGRTVIVRSGEPVELVKALAGSEIDHLVGVQILSMSAEVNALADWGYAVPVELVMLYPATEFPLLYRHAKLLDKHPVRVSIPVASGFSRAVKVANSLAFAVKLELGQPDASVLEELHEVLGFYLHQPLVAQPIEPFHGLLMAAYYGDTGTLWDMQEEDPAYIRYVTEEGEETIARRFAGKNATGNLASFVTDLKSALLAERAECEGCEFFAHCGGYFKWPRKEFACAGVKLMFRTLREATEELQRDLTVLLGSREEALR